MRFVVVRSFFRILCFFLDELLGGWSQWMWLLSYRRQEILTQGSTPDPKCGLNITSFLTLPHRLHCLICAKDIKMIVSLLEVMIEWEGWGWFISATDWVGRENMGIIFFLSFSFFVLLLMGFPWLVHHSLLCLFNYFLFSFFFSGPFN